MLKHGVYSLGICAICLFVISVPLFAEVQADPLYAAGLTVTESEKAEFLKLPIKYNPKTISVEKCRAILLSSPGTNAALEAQAHLLAHDVYSNKAIDIRLSMQSLYQQYGSLSSMIRAVKIIASAFEEKKDYAAVIPLYTEAINTLKDKNGQYWLKGSLVRAYIETGQNDKADALITEALAKCLADSSNADSLKIFLLPLNTDNTQAASARVYSEALKAWGAFDLPCGFRRRLVKGYVQLKEYDKAMALARIAFERDIDDPGNVQDINEIARMMSKLGNKEEAVKIYQAVIQKHPEHPQTHEAYERLIVDLQDLGRKEQAAQLIEDYTAKYAGKPDYMDPAGKHASFVLAAEEIVKRLQRRGQVDEALTLAEGLNAGQNSPSMESIQTLAVSRIKAGKPDEAAELIKKLLKDYPKDEAGAMAVVEVASALREAGQMDTAMGLYEYAMGIAKGTKAGAMARAGRAQIWVTQGKDEDVKAEVNRIIADANSLPDADRALFQIGEEYYLAGQKTGNDELFYKSIALLKDIPLATNKNKQFAASVQYMLGLNYQYLGEYLKAASAFEDAYAADPKFMYAEYCLFAAGYCNEKLLGQKLVSEAEGRALIRHIYTQFLQIYPDTKRVSYVREWLKNNPE